MKALLLAAGLGTRLQPLTNNWPKCLMPINKRPLLEYWLETVKKHGITDVLVNLYHHSSIVQEFINQSQYKDMVTSVYEPDLLGTAGTLRENIDFFKDEPILMVHADNWCCCDFAGFISYHQKDRPKETVITMMTFDSSVPENCGIVEIDKYGVVIDFHEKIKNPPSNLANAAVYLIEPEVIDWICKNTEVTDFSTEVLANYIGKIATWKNDNIHIDIGTPEMLLKAQHNICNMPFPAINNKWQQNFLKNPIQQKVMEIGDINNVG